MTHVELQVELARLNVTHEELAKAIGVNRSTISRYAAGHRKISNLASARICAALANFEPNRTNKRGDIYTFILDSTEYKEEAKLFFDSLYEEFKVGIGAKQWLLLNEHLNSLIKPIAERGLTLEQIKSNLEDT